MGGPFWYFGAFKIKSFGGTGPRWSPRDLLDGLWDDFGRVLGGFGRVLGDVWLPWGELFGGTAVHPLGYMPKARATRHKTTNSIQNNLKVPQGESKWVQKRPRKQPHFDPESQSNHYTHKIEASRCDLSTIYSTLTTCHFGGAKMTLQKTHMRHTLYA